MVRRFVESGRAANLALIAPTASDARDVLVEGSSGLLSISPAYFRPIYEPSKRRLTWPNGSRAILFSAEEPDRLRGPQFDFAYCDEFAAWRYLDETYDNLQMGLRLGTHPRQVITTTPRPLQRLIALLDSPDTMVTRGHTRENLDNVSPDFVQAVLARYEGTRLGRQELAAEILSDNPAALWQRSELDQHRIAQAPALLRVVVGVDPAASASENSDYTGIVVVGRGVDGRGYVLADCSLQASPNRWGRAVVRAYEEFGAERVVAEVNNGGDMVESVLRTVSANLSYKGVHASRGKYARAEPVAALYEQGKISHIGQFAKLEDEMTEYDPVTSLHSPDRMDALVWALTEVMELNQSSTGWLDYLHAQANAHA